MFTDRQRCGPCRSSRSIAGPRNLHRHASNRDRSGTAAAWLPPEDNDAVVLASICTVRVAVAARAHHDPMLAHRQIA
jgi:hypothetical protein